MITVSHQDWNLFLMEGWTLSVGQGLPGNGKVGNGIGVKIRREGMWVGYQAEWHKWEPSVETD